MAVDRLDPPFLHDPALQAVLKALPNARLVGGCVRDALVGLTTADIDLATPDPPGRVIERLAASGLKMAPTGLQHGTVTAISDHRGFEVTTLRRDVATDGRHATVAWTDDWREDAARRDFTINAMSMTPDGAVHDYFGGRADLAAGQVRFVGAAAERIGEDYLRILRFFRFHARYGAGPADTEAIGAIRQGVPGLARLSPERVWSELKRILIIPALHDTLALMRDTGVLAALLPDTAPDDVARLAPRPLLRLASLSRAEPGVLADLLRFSVAERDALFALRNAPPLGPAVTEDDLRRALAQWPADALVGAACLNGLDGDALAARLAPLKVHFPLEGRDAISLGVPPGPRIGALLREVKAWWLAGGARADAVSCRAELARLVAAQDQA